MAASPAAMNIGANLRAFGVSPPPDPYGVQQTSLGGLEHTVDVIKSTLEREELMDRPSAAHGVMATGRALLWHAGVPPQVHESLRVSWLDSSGAAAPGGVPNSNILVWMRIFNSTASDYTYELFTYLMSQYVTCAVVRDGMWGHDAGLVAPVVDTVLAYRAAGHLVSVNTCSPLGYQFETGKCQPQPDQEAEAESYASRMEALMFLSVLSVLQRSGILHNDIHAGNVLWYPMQLKVRYTTLHGVQRVVRSNYMPALIDWDNVKIYDFKTWDASNDECQRAFIDLCASYYGVMGHLSWKFCNEISKHYQSLRSTAHDVPETQRKIQQTLQCVQTTCFRSSTLRLPDSMRAACQELCTQPYLPRECVVDLREDGAHDKMRIEDFIDRNGHALRAVLAPLVDSRTMVVADEYQSWQSRNGRDEAALIRRLYLAPPASMNIGDTLRAAGVTDPPDPYDGRQTSPEALRRTVDKVEHEMTRVDFLDPAHSENFKSGFSATGHAVVWPAGVSPQVPPCLRVSWIDSTGVACPLGVPSNNVLVWMRIYTDDEDSYDYELLTYIVSQYVTCAMVAGRTWGVNAGVVAPLVDATIVEAARVTQSQFVSSTIKLPFVNLCTPLGYGFDFELQGARPSPADKERVDKYVCQINALVFLFMLDILQRTGIVHDDMKAGNLTWYPVRMIVECHMAGGGVKKVRSQYMPAIIDWGGVEIFDFPVWDTANPACQNAFHQLCGSFGGVMSGYGTIFTDKVTKCFNIIKAKKQDVIEVRAFIQRVLNMVYDMCFSDAHMEMPECLYSSCKDLREQRVNEAPCTVTLHESGAHGGRIRAEDFIDANGEAMRAVLAPLVDSRTMNTATQRAPAGRRTRAYMQSLIRRLYPTAPPASQLMGLRL
jgi:hypothetical protein